VGCKSSQWGDRPHHKEGVRNQKLKFNYSGSVTYQGKPDFNYERMLSSQQFIEAAQETFDP